MIPVIAKMYKQTITGILSVLVVISFSFADERQINTYPKGKKIDGEVQFDSILILNAPIAQTKIALIVRYYVSSEAIAYDLIWAEPAWMAVNYPFPPFDLTGYIDQSFFLLQQGQQGTMWEHELGYSVRGIFGYVANNYSIDDQRHAFMEYHETRLVQNPSDSTIFMPSKRGGTQKYHPWYLSDFTLAPNQIDIVRKEEYDHAQNLFFASKKQVNYFYEGTELVRSEIKMPEYLYPATGFRINVVDKNKNKYTLTQVPVAYHQGGRIAKVEYRKEQNSLLPQVLLPRQISVYSETERDQLRRSAKLYNFKKIPPGTVAGKKGNPSLLNSPIFDDEYKEMEIGYLAYSRRYWKVKPSEVPEEKRLQFTRFAEKCMERFNSIDDPFIKLRFISRFTLAHMLAGNHSPMLEVGIPLYLSTMEHAGLDEVSLFALGDLIILFASRGEEELLSQFYSSAPILEYCLKCSAKGIEEALMNKPELALFLCQCTESQWQQSHTTDDEFLIRCSLVKALQQLTKSYNEQSTSDDQVPLSSFFEMSRESLIAMAQQQKKETLANYEKISSPTDSQRQMHDSLLTPVK